MPDIPTPGNDPLARRLAEIRARHPGSDPEMVAEVVRAVLETHDAEPALPERRLLAEVEEIGRLIAATRAEIAALQVDDISASHIPAATDELDAIVQHTAHATDCILEVCETLDGLAAGAAEDPASLLQQATTRIYEACSFQDITGQRIAKVVGTLKMIDERLGRLVAGFGGAAAAPPRSAPVPAKPGEPLLHGPQLPAAAMQQTDIDALLASFD
jgi:chemotaxis protein CheZ